MKNNYVSNWTVESGDYLRENGDYDKLYVKGKRRDKVVRGFIWICVAFLTSFLFFQVLAYTTGK